MKNRRMILFLVALVSSIATTISSAQTQDEENIFIKKYVKAINEKDVEQMKQLMYPASRGCINQASEMYFDDIFAEKFRYKIPNDYTALIKPLSEDTKNSIKKGMELAQKTFFNGLSLPIIPSDQLQINYNTGDYAHSYGLYSYLVRQGDDFYEVYACPSPGWMQEYMKMKAEKKEKVKDEEKYADASEKYDKSLPLNQRRSFYQDEYGMLYWEGEENWLHNWEFRSRVEPKSVEIILVDQDGKQTVLVDSETMGGHSPLNFGFRLNASQLMGSSMSPVLSVPFGFSRKGDHPLGLSNWATLKGKYCIEEVYNKNVSGDDVLTNSGEIVLAKYKTTDGVKEFKFTIEIKSKG